MIKYPPQKQGDNYTIPDTVTEISGGSFESCAYLRKIIFPDDVLNIPSSAFASCKNLSDVTLPKNLTDIGASAFANCPSLSKILLPDGVENIGQFAFGNSGLDSLILPNSVTFIDQSVFESCQNMVSITIPKSVSSIDLYAFDNCNALKDIYYNGTPEEWSTLLQRVAMEENAPLFSASIHYTQNDKDTPDDTDKPGSDDNKPTQPIDSVIVKDKFTIELPDLDKKDYTLTIKDYAVGEDVSPVEVKNFQEFLADKGTVEKIYDIHLETTGGDPYTGGMVTITLKMQLDPTRNYTVYHQGDNRALSTRRQGNTALQFRTNRFSLYAVVSTPKPATSTSSRSSGGSSMVGFTSYVITAKAGAGGSISSPGETRYDAGTNVTYTITPNAGYAVDKVIVDGKNEVALTNGTYTFRLLNQPYTIEATFKPVSGGAAQPSAPAAAAPNPATGDSWFSHLFF